MKFSQFMESVNEMPEWFQLAKGLISIDDLAKLLGISTATVHKKIKNGQITPPTKGNDIQFDNRFSSTHIKNRSFWTKSQALEIYKKNKK